MKGNKESFIFLVGSETIAKISIPKAKHLGYMSFIIVSTLNSYPKVIDKCLKSPIADAPNMQKT